MTRFDYRKFERLELLALKNAMRLHDDSIRMFKQKRYPAALQLSVLAQEEFGKVLIIEDVVWNRRFNKMTDEWTQKWFDATREHKFKQVKILRDSKFPKKKAMKLMQKIMDGQLEKEKQAATYAGLEDNKISGRIVDPFKVSSNKALSQISKLNREVLSISEKIKKGSWELESEIVQKHFKQSIYAKLVRRKRKIEKFDS
jgi:AbiV family abortive infection protein